jgi:hypothetical protein
MISIESKTAVEQTVETAEEEVGTEFEPGAERASPPLSAKQDEV